MKNGFGFVDILFKEVGSVDHWGLRNGKSNVFEFERNDWVIGPGRLSKIVFMVIWSNKVENFRSVVNFCVNELFEEMGRGNIDL